MKGFYKVFAGVFAITIAFLSVGCIPAPHAEEISVYLPDGAPALSLAQCMAEDTPEDGVSYYVNSADKITSKLTNKEMKNNADLCILPLTAAAKFVGDGEKYTMLGGVTHGNLYLISKLEGQFDAYNLTRLIGKNIGVLQMNNVPGLTLKAMLNKHGIAWSEMTNEGTMYEDKVNLIAISGPDAVGVLDAEYFLLGEPAVSAQSKKGYSIVGDLQMLYGGENGYPQAVLVAKNSLLEERLDWVKAFVQNLSGTNAWLQSTDPTEIVSAVSAHMEDAQMATSLKAPMLTREVLSRCSVRFVYAADCKTQANALLQDFLQLQPNATKLPSEHFYWNYTEGVS